MRVGGKTGRFLRGRLRHSLQQVISLDPRVLTQISAHLDQGDEPSAVLVLETMQVLLDGSYELVYDGASLKEAMDYISGTAVLVEQWTVNGGYRALYQVYRDEWAELEYTLRDYTHDGRSGHWGREFTVFVN